jgi:predicted enzyme related to lactoylglutathione lyase
MKRRDPRGAVYNTIAVPWVDDYIAKVIELGGKLVVPKMPIPGVGYLAYCQDTEGNVFGSCIRIRKPNRQDRAMRSLSLLVIDG